MIIAEQIGQIMRSKELSGATAQARRTARKETERD
jgi:hypothetical protein